MEKGDEGMRNKFVDAVMDDRRPPHLSALIALCGLKENFPFTPEQRQELINRISRHPGFAKRALAEVSGLTEAQKIQLQSTQ